ncbi:MAG: hypothetical protein QG657_3601 [Acidobacteriota bacterium]|nr:hypothetical protein [Acidobacteriota bacterium]
MTIAGKGPEALNRQVTVSGEMVTSIILSNEKKRPRVFLCHASEDKAFASALHVHLKAAGLDPWLDKEKLRGGDLWDDMIQMVIKKEIDYFLVLQSKSLKKVEGYVHKEIYEARERQKAFRPGYCFIIPLIIDESGILEELEAFHAISIDSEYKIEELIRVIESDYKKRGESFERVETPPPADEEPIFVRGLKLKGWDVKKNESDCWEAFYKTYDLTMIYIPPGKFIMGADDGKDFEKPPHEVNLDGYWMGKYEVTFVQYDRYCAETGKKKPDDKGWGRENRPVIHISWDDAVVYCDWLSQKTGLTFKLPTEAQWEKAARGTGGLVYPWGNEFDKNKCNSAESGLKMTSLVELYLAGKSPYGCMDMAGNVWEWCADWYDKDYYKISPAKNPMGPAHGSVRVRRGGSCVNAVWFCRAVSRNGSSPAHRADHIGFRLMMII